MLGSEAGREWRDKARQGPNGLVLGDWNAAFMCLLVLHLHIQGHDNVTRDRPREAVSMATGAGYMHTCIHD